MTSLDSKEEKPIAWSAKRGKDTSIPRSRKDDCSGSLSTGLSHRINPLESVVTKKKKKDKLINSEICGKRLNLVTHNSFAFIGQLYIS